MSGIEDRMCSFTTFDISYKIVLFLSTRGKSYSRCTTQLQPAVRKVHFYFSHISHSLLTQEKN